MNSIRRPVPRPSRRLRRRPSPVLPLLLALLASVAGCGGSDGVRVSGTLADVDGEGDDVDAVRAVEAGREARVRDGAWALEGLAPGPLHLELMREGRAVGRVALDGLAPGTELELRGLRTDRWTELAFPASVAVRGADDVRVNGLRMASADRLPAALDVEGEVLAADPGAGLLVVRPADAALPDLRVLLGTRTALRTDDEDEAEPDDFGEGDRVRLRGSVRDGYVLAEAFASEGAALDGDAPPAVDVGEIPGEGVDVDVEDESPGQASSGGASPAPSPAPVVPEPPRSEPPEAREAPGSGRGKARGHEKNPGRGRGPGGR